MVANNVRNYRTCVEADADVDKSSGGILDIDQCVVGSLNRFHSELGNTLTMIRGLVLD